MAHVVPAARRAAVARGAPVARRAAVAPTASTALANPAAPSTIVQDKPPILSSHTRE